MTATDRKGQTSTLEYDPLNRRIRSTFADGAVATFTYDAGGRLVQADDTTDPHRPITLGYDLLDRLLTETTALGTVGYQYDALGRRTQMTVGGQSPVNYAYDANSRLRTITQVPLNPVDIQYDALNRRTLLVLPNGVSTEYQFDAASRLTALIYRNALGALDDLQYTYDPAGNRIAVSGSFARTLVPDVVPSASYDTANRQVTFGDKSMSFDANGNLASLTAAAGTTTYTWDPRSRLVGIGGPSLGASFAYDGVGRRAVKIINGQDTGFQYDGLDIVQESGGTGAVSYLRTLAIDEALAQTDTTSSLFYLADALGSGLALTDSTGATPSGYGYAPFGETSVSGLPFSNPFQFTGRENDGTGLYYYRARYYDPVGSRFIVEDPFTLLLRLATLLAYIEGDDDIPSFGNNSYEYAASNPLARIDPFGLDWIYSQSTGQLFRLTNFTNVEYVASGYSGHGEGLNNPVMQGVENVGPTPQGLWAIGPQQTIHVGQPPPGGRDLSGAMRLRPRGSRAQHPGRSGGFLMHRGSFQTMNSSRGCIILPPNILNQIGSSGDTRLRVVP